MNRILLISITLLLFIGIGCASATNLDMEMGDNVVADGDDVSIKEATKTITKDQLKCQVSHVKNKKVTKGKDRPQLVLTRGTKPTPIIQGRVIYDNLSETDFSKFEQQKNYDEQDSSSEYAEIKKSGKDHGGEIYEQIKNQTDPTKPDYDDLEKYLIKPVNPSGEPPFGEIFNNESSKKF